MNRSKTTDRLQNLAMALLTVTALLLLSRIPLLGDSGWTDRLQSILTASPSGGQSEQIASLSEVIATAHLMVTGDSEHGRYGQLYVDAAALQQMGPLFQEALGSATVVGATADKTLQEALETPSLYLDLTCELPLAVIAAWLGEGASFDRDVRSMALTTEEADAAVLYLRSDDGSIFRYNTALPVSAVQELTRSFSPNGGRFAFESNYSPLAPYTVLIAQLPPVLDIRSELPAGYTDYDLLTALDFNAHTNFRYPESDGTEVIVASPRTLRVSPDGTVTYSSDGEVSSSLYQVASPEGAPTEVEALQAAGRIAQALTDCTQASPLFLRSVEATETGYQVDFCYQAEGFPVFFPDDSEALSVTISGSAVTSFVYRCRLYTATEQTSSLLPPDMAIAIASLRPGSGLAIGYVDSGFETLSARWLAS